MSERVGTWLSGVLAAAAGLVITFWSDHSPAAGALVFGLWALAAGLTELVFRGGPLAFDWRLGTALVTTLAGAASLLVPHSAESLAALISGWAIATALFALPRLRADRAASLNSQRGLFIGLTLGLAAGELLSGGNSVVVVGLLGAYLVIVAVWQLIGAASPAAQLQSGEPHGQNAQ